MAQARLILASSSPQRLALLRSIRLEPDLIIPADIDERPLKGEIPRDYVLRIALAKAGKISALYPADFIVAADTIGATKRRIIGKAESKDEARVILQFLSGRRHSALTGLCVVAPGGKVSTRIVETVVKFKPLTRNELEDYLDSDAWQGKSGCYGLQSEGGGFVEWVNGSYSNVVGLPLVETQNLLKGLGFTR